MVRMVSGNWFVLVLLLPLLSGLSFFHSSAAPPPSGEDPGSAPYTLADSPLQIRSWEEDGLLVAEIGGMLDYPFSRVGQTLTSAGSWCEFIPLLFNVKSCTHQERQNRTVLTFYVGRKFYDSTDEAFRLQYRFRVPEKEADRFRVDLFAPEGPHGTRDYHIELEARSTTGGRTAIRLQSSFRSSLRSKLATSVYLATSGQDKVGFSVLGQDGNGPVYVGGMRGIVERNAMRYYLALKAFLDTLHLPEAERFEARLHAWYGMTEKYPRQLHEMGKKEYLDGKRQERRQQLRLQEELARPDQIQTPH